MIKKAGYLFREDCPFCLGNEAMTPPEITRVKKPNGAENDWFVRVVPNKYPITDIHEVVIHSPDHRLDIAEMELSHLEELILVYRFRYRELSKEGTVLIFNNKGIDSGESLLHPHSQIVVIPKQIKIDVLPLEPVRNIVVENDYFVTYCPDFSQWPYEVWITGKKCGYPEDGKELKNFGQITREEISHLAVIMQTAIRKLIKKFPEISYNFYISPYEPCYIRFIPRLTSRAGFELGTGLNVNVVDPTLAAEELKK